VHTRHGWRIRPVRVCGWPRAGSEFRTWATSTPALAA